MARLRGMPSPNASIPSLSALPIPIPIRAVRAAEDEDGDMPPSWRDLPPRLRRADPASLEWLFWSFFLCMAVAALPLVGIRWTTPEGAQLGEALDDILWLALPVLLPLPCLFAGCVGALVLNAASRTAASLAGFGLGIAIGLAAVHAVLA